MRLETTVKSYEKARSPLVSVFKTPGSRRASGRTCRKSLIIHDQIVHPPPTFTQPFPNLSEVIRSFALKPVLRTRQEWKIRTLTSALTAGLAPPLSRQSRAGACRDAQAKTPLNFELGGSGPRCYKLHRSHAFRTAVTSLLML